MDTVSILMAQYGGKAIVPLADVCRDYFAPLTAPTLVRKISAGEIELILVRMEHSRKSAKGVRIQDLAHYIDTRETIGAEATKAASALAETPKSRDSGDLIRTQSVAPPVPRPEGEGAVEPTLERALTLKMAADLLKVSYSTVYAHKEELGFFQIGSQWRIWPDTLKTRLAAKQEEKARRREKTALPVSESRMPSHLYSPSARKAQRELDELLARPSTRRNRKAGTK
jgi:excisionase family DNA binding protein